MKLRAIIPQTTSAPEARKIRACAMAAKDMRDAFDKLKTYFPPRLIVGDNDEVSVHEPAQDGASGRLGHIGLCIGRIVPC